MGQDLCVNGARGGSKKEGRWGTRGEESMRQGSVLVWAVRGGLGRGWGGWGEGVCLHLHCRCVAPTSQLCTSVRSTLKAAATPPAASTATPSSSASVALCSMAHTARCCSLSSTQQVR